MNVAAGGIVYRYDGFRWTPHVVDDGRQGVRAIARDGEAGLAAGAGGKVYERRSAGQWQRFETGVETKLRGVAIGETHDVAVGGGGTIVERTVEGSDGGENGTDSTNTTTGTNETTASAGFDSDGISVALSDEPLTVENYVEGEWMSTFDL